MKGQPPKGGQSLPLIPEGRIGIVKFSHVEARVMQTTKVRRISGGKGVYLMVLGLSENPMRTQLIPAERLES